MIAQSWHREPQSLSQIRIHSSALDLPAPELGQEHGTEYCVHIR
jgi:hypothetical protein